MIEQQEWQQAAIALSNTGVMSRREIAKYLGIPRSTCLDFLRAYYSSMADLEDKAEDVVAAYVGKKVEEDITHLVIPDSQVRPGISLEYLRWIGEYIVKSVQPLSCIWETSATSRHCLSGMKASFQQRVNELKRISKSLSKACGICCNPSETCKRNNGKLVKKSISHEWFLLSEIMKTG